MSLMNLTQETLLLYYFLAINLAAFLLYGIDKFLAKRHARRVPEATLFFLALLGGSLGAWLGMYAFRHKTKQKKFVVGIPLILSLQMIAIVWLHFA